VYAAGYPERTTLRQRLAAHPQGEALARYVLIRRLGLREIAFERQLLLPSGGWLARPSVFVDYVRSWLARTQSVLDNRHDPELCQLLEAPAHAGVSRAEMALRNALLTTLAPLCFALRAYRVVVVRGSLEVRARSSLSA
jgi:hypothetical protein